MNDSFESSSRFEAALRESEARYRMLFDSIDEGFCVIEVIFDHAGRAVDYIFLEINPAFQTQTGISNAVGRRMRDIAPDHEEHWFEIYGHIARTGKSIRFEHRADALGRMYDVYAFPVEPFGKNRVAVLFTDILARKQAETALRESEERMRLAAEAAGFGTYDLDPVSQTAIWSDQLRVIVGYRGEMPITIDQVGEFIHPDDLQHFYTCMKEASAPSATGDHAWEYRMIGVDGDVRWLRDVGRTLYEGEGDEHRAIRILGTVQDITDRKQAEDALRSSEERLQLALTAGSTGVWDWDLINDVATLSDSYRELFGIAANVPFGYEQWIASVHPDDRERCRNYGDRVFATPTESEWNLDFRIVTPHCGIRWHRALGRIERDEDGTPVRFVGVSADVTELKHAEDAVKRARDELELRVEERTAELRLRAEQLARLTSELTLTEQRERQRLAQILHDHLQQLLVGAKLRLELLARTASPKQAPRVEEATRLVQEAIAASRSLTVELAPPILQEAGLGAGLEWLARWMEEKHGLTVSVSAERQVVTENEDVRVLVFQSVRELLFNVVKHSGVTCAEVDFSLPDPEHLQVVVTDQGSGFDPEVIFARERDDNSGYGLFSIRERILLLGGAVQVESSPNHGTRFTIIAPTRAHEAAVPQPAHAIGATEHMIPLPPPSVRTGDQPIRVIVVDDHNLMRDGLTMLLRSEAGIDVISEAADGIEAIEQARALQPDVILMDFSMPRMDGLEATRRIKAEMPHIEIIGLSMYPESERANAMIEAGASSYRTKSGNTDDIIDAIRSAYKNA